MGGGAKPIASESASRCPHPRNGRRRRRTRPDRRGRLPVDVPGRGADVTGFEFDRGAHESITGRTGYRTVEIIEALLTRTSPVPQSDPLDVNDDSEFDAADAAANVNDVNDALP